MKLVRTLRSLCCCSFKLSIDYVVLSMNIGRSNDKTEIQHQSITFFFHHKVVFNIIQPLYLKLQTQHTTMNRANKFFVIKLFININRELARTQEEKNTKMVLASTHIYYTTWQSRTFKLWYKTQRIRNRLIQIEEVAIAIATTTASQNNYYKLNIYTWCSCVALCMWFES